MRRLVLFCTLASAVCVAAVDSAIRAIDAALRFIFDAVATGPALVFVGGAGELTSAAPTYRDPSVERHEAGMSRRAAARRI